MSSKKINRRDFFKNASLGAVAAVAAGSIVNAADANDPNAAITCCDDEKSKMPQVPQRQFGSFDQKVSILSLGGMFDIPKSQMHMQRAVDWGVTYWDTAHGYMRGKSEEGIGMVLKRKPELRKKLFIVTKASGASDVAGVEERFAKSLERMNTDYVDLYYGVHGLRSPDQLTDELKEWAAKAKKDGRIKYFGFSTHTNMAECIKAAAELDWIDAVMTTYNYRLLDDKPMQEAVDAFHKKGKALIAMKTQAKSVEGDVESEKLIAHFQDKGYTPEQAKLKVVWDDKRFCAICSQMPTATILLANVAAAMDKTSLGKDDVAVLNENADQTFAGYCDGCENICGGACPDMPYIRDVMRCMMYENSYNDSIYAMQEFETIPVEARNMLGKADFSAAEKMCPRNLPIADLMSKANSRFV